MFKLTLSGKKKKSVFLATGAAIGTVKIAIAVREPVSFLKNENYPLSPLVFLSTERTIAGTSLQDWLIGTIRT